MPGFIKKNKLKVAVITKLVINPLPLLDIEEGFARQRPALEVEQLLF